MTTGPTIIVGRKGSYGEVNYSDVPCWPIDTAYYIDGTCTEQDLGWLKHVLPSLGMTSMNRAAAVPGLNREDAYRASLRLPPIEEQRRIAAILDHADWIVRRRHEEHNLIESLQYATFNSMFRVNEGPVRREALGNLGRVTTGRTPPTAAEGMFGGSVPFVTPGDLEGRQPAHRSVTLAGAAASRTVRAGSTLVCCIGATIGKVDIASETSAFNQQINAIEWGDSVTDIYGLFALRAIKPTIVARGASTTLPLLPKSKFSALEIPVPPLADQHRFAAISESARRYGQRIRRTGLASAALFTSLQARAFRGEL